MRIGFALIGSCLLCVASAQNLSAAEGDQPSKMHSIRVQVLLVEAGGTLDGQDRQKLSGSIAEVMKALSALVNEGKATIVNHAELTTLEEQETMLQVGETVALRTGSLRTAAGRPSSVYKDVSLGTLIRLNSKVVGETIVIEIDFSKSYLAGDGDDDDEDDEDSERPQGTSQLTHEATLQIHDGEAQLVSRVMSRSGDATESLQLIVAADILGAGESAHTTKFKSSSRHPIRASARVPGKLGDSHGPRGGSIDREEARQRLAEAMFDRADANDDGEISKNELARLNPRDLTAEPPITREQYVKWVREDWNPGASARPGGLSRRPGSATFTPPRQRSAPDDRRDDADTDDGKESDAEKENADQDDQERRKTGSAQIEVVPELGTIILRGTEKDVKRVAEVIERIGKSDDNEKDHP